MNKIYAVNEISSIAAPILEAFGVERAWVFGSYARGDATENSDIDLKIEGGQIRGMFGLGRLYDELTQALSKSVDLVTTEGLNHKANRERTKEFRESISEDEKLIYENKLTGHLSEDYRETTKESVYWPAIKGMRNVFAHDYGAIDYDRGWDTVTEDVPILLEFCQKEILSYQIAEHEEEL